METEAEISKNAAIKTDDGFSEKKIAVKIDLGVSAKATIKGGNLFASNKVTQQTVFQAQKDEEI